MIVFVLCFLAYFRGINVGTDTWVYARNFRFMSDAKYTWNRGIPVDIGFNYFMLYFKKLISDNPLDCLGIVSVTYVLGYTSYAWKYSKDFMGAILLFILFGSYFLCYNIIRQCFALGLVMLCFCFYDIRKLKILQKITIACFISIIAYLIHPSVAITLLILTYRTKFSKVIMRKKVIISLIVISFFLFYFRIIIPYITSFMDIIGISGKLYSYMIKNVQTGDDSGYSIFKLLIISCFQIYTIICCKSTKSIFLYISSLGIIYLNIFAVLTIELVRVYESLICLGLLGFVEVANRNRRNSIIARCYPYVLIVYCSILYLNILMSGYGGIIPYNFR